ncbi:50S ribosomal protein L32 [bacterium]|nr:50S ribosomal protein L32 [bacterium]
MANPKRRHSQTRRDKRRTHDSLTAPQTLACSNCGYEKKPHVVCPKCGFYKGRRVIALATVAE